MTRKRLIPVSQALKGASEYHAHMEQWRASRVVTPCAAWHRTFEGLCLNCGYRTAPLDLRGSPA